MTFLKNLPLIKTFFLLPQPYFININLIKKSQLVITDSGGIQEETSYLNIPCLTTTKEYRKTNYNIKRN